jgi:RNA polymerase primary sigma factor
MAKQKTQVPNLTFKKSTNEELASSITLAKTAYTKLINNEITLDEFERIQTAANSARDKLVVHNQGLVAQIAKYFPAHPPITTEELISEGHLGLLGAVEQFNADYGCFCTYAFHRIRTAMICFINTQSSAVSVPGSIMQDIGVVRRAIKEFVQLKNRKPTAAELAESLHYPLSRIRTLLAAIQVRRPNISFDNTEQDHPTSWLDPKSADPAEQAENKNYQIWINTCMNCLLSERSKQIIQMYYGLDDYKPHTLEQIGQKLELTKERVRQIHRDSLTILRRQTAEHFDV